MLFPIAGIVNNCVNPVSLFEKYLLRRQQIVQIVPLLLPFPLSSGIISVCLDLAGRFRNKDIHPC
jgi:hypothetical protein